MAPWDGKSAIIARGRQPMHYTAMALLNTHGQIQHEDTVVEMPTVEMCSTPATQAQPRC